MVDGGQCPEGASGWVRTVAVPHAGGGTTEYWETLWAAEKAEAPPFLLRELRDELTGRARVLESGCGSAPFVDALATDDRTVIGVDLAQQALAHARELDPDLALAVADVSRLPFADGAFDAIVSLGVVEHFEGGPVAVLREHRRALAHEGILVLTVPRRSGLRAVRDWWHLGVRRRASYTTGRRIVTRRRSGRAASTPGDFHQYEWSKRQLLGFLDQAGFAVTAWRPLDVGSALGEAGLSRFAAATPAASAPGGADTTATPAGSPAPRGLRATASRVVLGSDPVGPVGSVARRSVRLALGHLQLVVASPK